MTHNQFLIAIGALTHGMQRGKHGRCNGTARSVLDWIKLVEAEL